MIDALNHLLRENPVGLLFVVLAFGYLIGKTRIRGFELGPVTGVLFAGLVFGHFGFEIRPEAKTFGFVLFIFSVGFQAGPSFFEVVRRDGARYFVLAMVVASTGFVLAAGFAGLLEFPAGISAGLLAGAMTTTPTLAAAQDTLQSGAVSLRDGVSAAQAVQNVGSAYAITYLFGLVGLIIIIRTLPGILDIDLAAEANKQGGAKIPAAPGERISVRAFRVEFDEMVGIPLHEMKNQFPDSAALLGLQRQGEQIEIDDEICFEIGDEILVVAKLDRFIETPRLIGTEIAHSALLDTDPESAQIVINRPEAVGLSLGELGVTANYSCFLTGLSRLNVDLGIESTATLQRGDVLSVTGPPANVEHLGERLGHLERPLIETDLLTLAMGIAVGIALGTLSVSIGGLSIGLGTAGGLLATGLLIGYLRSLRPTFGRIPDAARWLFMEFGLQIFMAGVGVSAGGAIVETLLAVGPSLALCGFLVTALPVATGWLVGRWMGLNPAVLLGAITGAMTSGAALSIVNSAARSTVPALGYTGAYAFANVILTIAGSLIVRL